MSEDLIAWLRACYDEDERTARAAGPNWDNVGVATTGVPPFVAADAVLRHMNRHDPDSVLADIAAKRAVLDAHHGDFPYNPDDGPGAYSWTEMCQECGHTMPCRTLRLLASAYAERPGYREEWGAEYVNAAEETR